MTPTPHHRGTILMVDDDPMILRAYGRRLEKAGFDITRASSGAEALATLRGRDFDAVVSDIDMPQMNGIELLMAIRAKDLQLPLIFATGGPSVDTAAKAVELGATRYLTKPVEGDVLVEAVSKAVRMHQLAHLRERMVERARDGGQIADRAGFKVRFERALDKLWIAFQPIVSWDDQQVFAYEALMRSDEPSLPHPGAILEAAERLDALPVLGRRIRQLVAEQAPQLDPDVLLFVNLHPDDLLDEALYQADEPLLAIADRVVLEITERATLDRVPGLQSRLFSLRERGFHFALDDLGAGYAGLSGFTQLEPDVVKLSVIQSMVTLCDDLGVRMVAEGVETFAERDALVSAGCDLLQGYLFAKPQRGFVDPSFG
jgi:EAL domain-containing protein (putative c-di-GMP-specific phosphodiesterase class I)/CheY-like chemotaxis protein